MGGSYGSLKKGGLSGQIHQIPAISALIKGGSNMTFYSGPALLMNAADHKRSASWRSRSTSFQWRQVQEVLLQKGKIGKAIEMDIRDIKHKFLDAYYVGIVEMINYTFKRGYITTAERNGLIRNYLFR